MLFHLICVSRGQNYTVRCQTLQNGAKPFSTVPNPTERCQTLQNGAKPIQYGSIPYRTVPNPTVRCHTLQNGAKPYSTVSRRTGCGFQSMAAHNGTLQRKTNKERSYLLFLIMWEGRVTPTSQSWVHSAIHRLARGRPNKKSLICFFLIMWGMIGDPPTLHIFCMCWCWATCFLPLPLPPIP